MVWSTLLFYLLLLSVDVGAADQDIKYFSGKTGQSVEELLRLGHAVRPYVIEWEPDETDLRILPNAPAERFVAVDDDELAYGHQVTVDEMLELLLTRAKLYGAEARQHLLNLVISGTYRLLNEYNLAGFVMQRLRHRQRELKVTPEDADLVMVGAGCTRDWYNFLDREDRALKRGAKPKPAIRFAALGSSFLFRDLGRHVFSDEVCYNPTAAMFFAHPHPEQSQRLHWVNMGYPTNLVPLTRGMKFLDLLFDEYAGRDVLLSFQGSIGGGSQTKHLTYYREHNVKELYAKSALVQPEGVVNTTFWPGLLTDVLKSGDPPTTKQLREQMFADRLTSSSLTTLLYIQSQFCFEPPGDNLFRRGVYDSIELGCVPVCLPVQREAMHHLMGGLLRRAGLSLDDVFYFLPDDQIKDGTAVLRDLQDIANDPVHMAWRRANLRRAARYAYLSPETNADDVLTVNIGLIVAGEHH